MLLLAPCCRGQVSKSDARHKTSSELLWEWWAGGVALACNTNAYKDIRFVHEACTVVCNARGWRTPAKNATRDAREILLIHSPRRGYGIAPSDIEWPRQIENAKVLNADWKAKQQVWSWVPPSSARNVVSRFVSGRDKTTRRDKRMNVLSDVVLMWLIASRMSNADSAVYVHRVPPQDVLCNPRRRFRDGSPQLAFC